MPVGRVVPGHERRACPSGRSPPHDVSRKSLLWIALLFSLHATCRHLPRASALSLPGARRPLRRRAVASDAFPSGASPAPRSASALRPASPAYRRDRAFGRPRAVVDRRKFFRREGNFQLNYKDHDDDLLSIIEGREPGRPVRPRIFPRMKRKSLSKALFPPELDVVQDGNSGGVILGSPAPVQAKVKGIGKMRRKKKSHQVVVTNIEELHEAILDRGLELRDVELNYSPPPSLLTSKESVSAENATQPDDLPIGSAVDELDSILSGAGSNSPANAEEWSLIGNVIAEDAPFPAFDAPATSANGAERAEELFSHDVLNILHQRYHSQSTPSNRAANDTASLALSIEGGGMRGAVSGGMAAAIACLGLSNAFDSIYGSSAGSIIGSYFVSRQLYLDVYTDVIPAGKDLFVSKPKIIGDIFRNAFHAVKYGPLGKRLSENVIERYGNPTAGANSTVSSMDSLPPTRAGGLNISFVLDSIMCPESGVRPLDLDAFGHNDALQPLRIVSSAVELDTGKLKSICFGAKEGHFSDQFANPSGGEPATDPSSDSKNLYPEKESAKADKDGFRRGMWACLGASMTVPGAAGSPFRMDLPSEENNEPTPHLCFDAFCYEPVPFRSAVAEGATHVVALRSRPAGYEPKTMPTFYERTVAPLYFKSNGVPNTVSSFVENGGQQYLYAEDILICDQGLNSTEAIPIPPASVLYAGSCPKSASDKDRNNWSRAHLLPITVPADIPELAVLSQDRDDILAGIRGGFAAAYDALAPTVGLEAGPGSLDGRRVAELVFPKADAPPASVLEKQYLMAGEKLVGKSTAAATEEDIISASFPVKGAAASSGLSSAPQRGVMSLRRAFRRKKHTRNQKNFDEATPPMSSKSDVIPFAPDSDAMFSFLPGLQLGKLPMVAERFQAYLEKHHYLEGELFR